MMVQYSIWISSLVLLVGTNEILTGKVRVNAEIDQSEERGREAPVCTVQNGCYSDPLSTITAAATNTVPSDYDENGTISETDTSTPTTTTYPNCRLWLAESSMFRGTLGVFSGIDISSGDSVGEGEMLLPIYDINDNERSQWQDFTWSPEVQQDLLLQNYYRTHAFIAGLASTIKCSKSLENVRFRNELHDTSIDSAGVHRSTHATAGSFGDRYPFEMTATQNIIPGQELFTHCDDVSPKRERSASERKILRPLSYLEENGVCMDGIAVKKSTIEGAGRGAFTNRPVAQGEIITTSPTLLIDRSQTDIVEQYLNKKGLLKFTENVTGKQLLLNYCYGHPNSTVLTLPYGPGVSFINHDGKQPNAKVQWSDALLSNHNLLDMTSSDILAKHDMQLLLEFVALRDLEPGEEILIDYGEEWSKAWDEHVQSWKAAEGDYISASDYKQTHPDDYIKTLEEQESDPYPENILTACMFMEFEELLEQEEEETGAGYYDSETERVFWTKRNDGYCLRPCDIVSRKIVGERVFYTVNVREITNEFFPNYCALTPNRGTVVRTPERAITLVDMEYTSDQFLPTAFRHEIGVSDGMYPDDWLFTDRNPMGDFLLPDLKPGQLEKIRWKKNGMDATENGYIMRFAPTVRTRLLEYCDRMGITELFRELTYRGNSLAPGNNRYRMLRGTKWFIQRPEGHWNSNMHWISPSNAEAQDDYWQALSAAGFDDVLRIIGAQLNLTSLAAYHVTFIGVSHCQKGYMHYDVTGTGRRVFNVIIPLILANETGPELDVRGETSHNGKLPVGRLRYQYDVASLMGDDTHHATSAVDYRMNKEMRMAATVYIADIQEDNIDAILEDYTQHYPPKGQPEILMAMSGIHWQRDDPSVRLPEPKEGHVLYETATEEIQ